MGLLEANNSERRDLAYNLTVSMMHSAVEACIDAEGHSLTFKALNPSIRLNADFCLANSNMFTGRTTQGVEGLLELMNWAMNMANRGKPSYQFTKEGFLKLELPNCRTRGGFPLMCEWWCQHEFALMCEDSNPDLVMSLTRSLPRGDDVCLWNIKRKDGKSLSMSETENMDLIHTFMSMDELDFWSQAGSAEFMTQATSCLVQMVGEDKALKLLRRRARENGVEFGAYYSRSSPPVKGIDVCSALDLFDSLLKMEPGETKRTDLSWEKEIKECPFSGFPPEVCAQIEELKRGAIGVLMPDQNWTFDERRVEGGPCIQSLILEEKGHEVHRQKDDIGSSQNELSGILKRRLAKGEISEMEYDRLVEKLTK